MQANPAYLFFVKMAKEKGRCATYQVQGNVTDDAWSADQDSINLIEICFLEQYDANVRCSGPQW